MRLNNELIYCCAIAARVRFARMTVGRVTEGGVTGEGVNDGEGNVVQVSGLRRRDVEVNGMKIVADIVNVGLILIRIMM